jgi:hypothetical protein
MTLTCILFVLTAGGQKKWDGEGGDNLWLTAANWQPDGVPEKGASVWLDNGTVKSSYTIVLPAGNISVSLATLQIAPTEGYRIRLQLPAGNTANPGLQITGSGESLVLEAGAELINASGATSGDPLSLSGLMRISNGAKYVHSTARSNARLIDRLSLAPGTETGIFEFDVPGTSGYIVSLSGNTFGTLVLSASAAGGTKSYSGSGSSELKINGHLIIAEGASFNSTMTADINLKGDLDISGNLQLNPSTAGTTGRSLIFSALPNANLRGNGTLTLQKNFRTIEVRPGTGLILERDIQMPFTGNLFSVRENGGLRMGKFIIRGEGSFQMLAGSWMEIGSPDGISAVKAAGNIQTRTRNFHKGSEYLYTGNGQQMSGDGLPDSINSLSVDKATGNLELTAHVNVTGRLTLASGQITTGVNNMLTFSGTKITSPASKYGETNAGWENSHVNGPFRRVSAVSDTMVFPIGKDGIFAPVKLIKAENTLATWKAEYFPVAYSQLSPVSDPPICNISREEYWQLSAETNGMPVPVTPVLSWRSLLEPVARDEWKKKMRIAQWENRGIRLQWEQLGETPYVTGNGNFGFIDCRQPTSGLSVLTLAETSPNKVLSLSGTGLVSVKRKAGVELSFRYPDVIDVRELVIEKSIDTNEFKWLADLAVRPWADRMIHHTDEKPVPGWNHYRIRMKTLSGNIEYSDVTSQFWQETPTVRIYPNPTHDRINLILPEKSSGFKCRIVNSNGEVVCRPLLEPGRIQSIDVRHLRNGHYFLILIEQERIISVPFVRS